MFLTKKYCYVDMNKTGSVYVNRILKALNDDYYFKHHKIPDQSIINNSEIKKFGTLRDPFSWYISLWSYGCAKQQQSGIFNSLTKFRPFKSYGIENISIQDVLKKQRAFLDLKLNNDTKKLYADSTNLESFNKWLKIVTDKRYAPIVEYPYFKRGLHLYAGIYSSRVLKFYFNAKRSADTKFLNKADFKEYLINECIVDRFILTNNLSTDLTKFLLENKFHNPIDLKSVIGNSKVANAASKKYKIYTAETFEIVLKKEKVILDYFKDYWGHDFESRSDDFIA